MTRILIPRSDNLSAKTIEASDWEKYFKDVISDYVICGLTITAQCPNVLAVDISTGSARLKGLYIEGSAADTVTGLTACSTNYIYAQICRDPSCEPQAWIFAKNTTGTTPACSMILGTVTTNSSTVTSICNDVRNTFPVAFDNCFDFGNGSDGDLTVCGCVDLGSCNFKQYNNLTINACSNLTGNSGMIIKVRETLSINATGSLNVNGKGGAGSCHPNGGGGSGGGGGGFLFVYANTVTGTGKIQSNGIPGGNGVSSMNECIDGPGSPGCNGYNNSSVVCGSRGGGSGGGSNPASAGGGGGGGSRGAGGSAGGLYGGQGGAGGVASCHIENNLVGTTYGGGGGSGGGCFQPGYPANPNQQDWSSGGGGGGAGGYIFAKLRDASTAISLEAKGGNGGNGTRAPSATIGGRGGGGGGGSIVLLYSKTDNTTQCVTGGAPGTVGNTTGVTCSTNGAVIIFRN